MGRVAALSLLCLMLYMLFPAVRAQAGGSGGVAVCGSDEYTAYPDVVRQLLPAYTVKRAEHSIFPCLEEGAAAEAFDTQALPALEAGLARYWYPHYLATVVIAVDRGRTGAAISGWRDLRGADEDVGFSDTNGDKHMLMAAMAYGLEGEAFTLKEAAKLLASLRAGHHLVRNSFQPAIVICYDYQAAALLQSGRDIEIVVPQEGTLAYEKGLLSNEPLDFAAPAQGLLLAAGFRLPDGRCDPALYPGEEAYKRASRVADYGHLSIVCQGVNQVLRRTVLRTRLFGSVDSREHQLFALLYAVLVIVWTAAVVRRAMQKRVWRACRTVGILLLCWIAVRLVKYQTAYIAGLNRLLWYAFYVFLLALPLVLLWLAWAIDQPEGPVAPPQWLALPAAASGALVALVFTNDWHHWVFTLDLSSPNWDSDYGYGPGYYAVMACGAAMVAAAAGLMLFKSRHSPRKWGFAYPLAFCALLAVYTLGYFLRVPPMWGSDLTMMAGLFTLLCMEAACRTGLIPVNTSYAALFTHSPLAMRLLDSQDRAVLSSTPGPLLRDGDTLLFAAPIAGGRVLWQENIGALNRLHREAGEQARRLAAANAVLAEEEKIQRAMEEERARTQILSQLEAEIAGHTARLSARIDGLEHAADRQKESARVMLLLCYIKRRCNLFFRAQETSLLPASEWMSYADELAELADCAGVKVLVTSRMEAPLPVRRATLFYDFFYSAVDWAAGRACACVLAHLAREEGGITLRLLPSEEARPFPVEESLAAAIAAAGGSYAVKDLDGAVGIRLTFPEGGERDG